MKKITTLLFSLLILSAFSFGQILPIQNSTNGINSTNGNTYHSRRTHVNPKFCATDDFHNKKMTTDSLYKFKHLESVNRFKNLPVQKNPTNGIYQVPVVVHVMHKGEAVGNGTNVSDADVKRGIQYLNNFWRKAVGTNGDGDGVDMQIEFTLAIQDESGNCTDGIDRVDMSSVAAYVNNGVNRNNANGIDDYDNTGGVNSLKEYSVWDQTEYYNVWIVDEIDNANCYSGGSYTAGYAYYASSHGAAWDGSVVLICSYLDENSDTWAHEMGHAFNLPHTFDGDNNGASCGDDGIFDTPQHARTSSISPSIYFDCTNTDANTCDPGFNEEINPDNGFIRNTGTHQDHMHNYMDYTGCSNEFTGGQRTVAQSAMTVERASFLTSPALTPPLPATVDFTSFAQVACLGSSIDFYDESTCTPNTYTNNGYAGISFLWTFDNGVNTPITSTDQNPTITFNNNGTYNVTLQITNPQGTTNLTKTGYITVTAGASASCSSSSSNNNNNFGCGVTSVSFNSLSNSTSTAIPSSGMQDFTCSNNTEVEVGNSYVLDVTYNSRGDGTQELEVWVDWDNSGTFETTNSNGDNERILTDNIAASSIGTPSTNVIPPANATLNTLLRMRVISEFNGAPTVCGNGFVQRADDYGVLVKSACSNPDIPSVAGATTICNGNNTNISIASGDLNDATDWQWYTTSCGGTSVGNGSLLNVSPTTTTTYFVRGEGGCVSPGSCAQVTITVNQAPTISSQPSNSTISENDNTTFSVTANNVTGYQWQEDSGSGYGNITNGGVYSGATSTTLTITSTPLSMNGNNYRCIITGTCTPNATTNNALLTVNTAACNNSDVPTISGTTTICNGDNTTLSIATGNLNDATDWQWYTTSCGGTPAGNGTSINISPTSTTTYFVRGEGGCVTPGSCTQVIVTVNSCGTTSLKPKFSKVYQAYSEKVACYKVINAQEYEFQFTPSGGGATIIYNRNLPNPSFLLGWVSGLTNNTTYDVQVRANVGGSFGNLGITRQITTPGNSNLSDLKPEYCNKTYINYSEKIVCYPVTSAQEYEFEFTPVLGGATIIHQTTANSILLSSITGLIDNTTYNVQIRVQVSGSYGAFGNTCQITTPSNSLLTSLKSNYCNITFTSLADKITCYPLNGAIDYEWEFNPIAGGATLTYSHGSTSNSINLNVISGLQLSTQYSVRVRPDLGSGFETFGNACNITTPASARIGYDIDQNNLVTNNESKTIYLTIYPNPNQGEFVYIELDGVNNDAELFVMDVSGKIIQQEVISSNSSTIRFNNKLKAGFYFITVVYEGQKVTEKLIVR